MRYALLLPAFALLAAVSAGPLPAQEVSFTKQVAPILVKNCIACHGASDPKGGYQLSTFEQMMKPGESTSASILAGKPAESELLRLISLDDKSQWMPKDGDKLPAEQVALVKKWIEEGAKFDSPDPKATLVSIIPKQPHPNPPDAYRVPVPVTAVCFNPPGTELAVGGYHEITIWNPTNGTLLRRIKNVAQRTYTLQYNADGSLLAAASGTPGQMGEVKLFNPADGAIVKDLGTMPDVAFDVAFSPNGQRIAGCSADRSIRVWNVATGAQELLIEDHADWVMGIAWNHDGSKLASASRDKTSKVFDAVKGESLVTFPGHNEAVFGVDFNADGTQVFTAGRDRKVQIWNPNDAAKIAELGGFGGEVYKVNVVANRVFCCAADNLAREFAADTRAQTRVFTGHTDWVFTESFNEPTKRLATGSFDGDVKIWNTDDAMLVLTFKAAPGFTPPQPAAK